MNRLKISMLVGLIALLLVAIGGFFYLRQPVFGSDPATTRLERIQQSPNYRNGSFQNTEPTDVMRQGASYFAMIGDYINKSPINTPPKPLPTVQTNLHALPDSVPTVVWFGHSSYLIKSKGVTILVDPVLSGSASPVSLFGRAFAGADAYAASDLPDIDMLVISHDHYDHLDHKTITELAPRVKKFYTALGVGAHLERWGISPDRIVEFDWGQTHQVADSIVLTATPARHFSGRSLARGRTLWTSFVFDLHGYRLFLGGDSGYDGQFKQIGTTYGPFDLAILECGQYGRDWPSIHMFPTEVATAAQDLRAKTLLPVHWGKFALAYHAWNEPIQQLVVSAAEKGIPVTTPRIGEPITVGGALKTEHWWNKL
ncbi:MBL fold metallo-hydrolase [Spirosoma montaniterrae]|uniref:MBL fold metallo-hydrolase n=1 Tax=Spirosoma montaniterrae TaxID=1178516 RepID=A0A1P9X3U5_9BACT|nr:MBL fold metallo-hydrolase [Spirosoma montaniterrae]AQG82291.1 MBL fold metallo-hydrolase [Spirosoma montaniterrae]